MNRIVKRITAMLSATVIIGTCAEAAEIAVSDNYIELAKNENTFSFEISIAENESFAGAEFGILLPDGATLKEVTYIDEKIKSSSHTPVVIKDDRAYFGFYQADNSFSGEYDVAELTFEYSGDKDIAISLDSSKIVKLKEDGKTEGDTSSEPFTVSVVRKESVNNSGGSGGGYTYYKIKFDSCGGSSVEDSSVRAGSVLNEPEKPTKEGYIFDGWYTDRDHTTKYDFSKKVSSSFTLYAKWKEENKINEDNSENDKWVDPFTDVKETDWFYNSVKYVNMNGYFNGVSDTEFAPQMEMSRAMMVTILYRAEQEPVNGTSISYDDVEKNSYYENAVIWAKENGIVNGYTDHEFAPYDNITREQLAAIMNRYAEYKGIECSSQGDIEIFCDAQHISEWAVDNIKWAVAEELFVGDNGRIDPLGSTTRAEAAAVFERFFKNIIK